MNKILGLDLGTNSIGWAIVQENNKAPILHKGTHIFSEGVASEKGAEFSKALVRTNFRSARKIKIRKRIRKQELLKVLIKNKMCPLPESELNEWVNSKKAYPNNPEFLKWLSTHENNNPYSFRNLASRKKVTLHEFGRALYHMCQRRGFLSNRLDNDTDGESIKLKDSLLQTLSTKSSATETILLLQSFIDEYSDTEDKECKRILRKCEIEIKQITGTSNLADRIITYLNTVIKEGAVEANITDLNKRIAEGGFDTLGQYFFFCLENNLKIRNNYTAREDHYLQEFNLLCETQNIHPDLQKKLYNAIFYQRPLKSQKGLVGKCTFETKKTRCPTSNPQFERFRMHSFINSIRYFDKNESVSLSPSQKEKISPLFYRVQKNFPFSDITKRLYPKNAPKFNFKPYDKVSNCPVLGNIKRCFEENAKDLTQVYSLPKNKNHYELEQMIWHALCDFNDSDKLIQWLNKNFTNTDQKRLIRLSQTIPSKEYGSLSLKAINNILPYLGKGYLYSHAVFMGNIKAVLPKHNQNQQDLSIVDSAIEQILADDTLNRKKTSVYNSFIFWFNQEHKKNSSKDYSFDASDFDKLTECLYNEWGKNAFQRLTEENRLHIKQAIQLQIEKEINSKITPKTIRFERIDDQILQFLNDNFGEENINQNKLYHPSDLHVFRPAEITSNGYLKLGSPRTDSVKNPMAMRTLFQLRRLVNTLLKDGKIDPDTKIHIELARELNDANKRIAIKKGNIQNAKLKEEAEKDIIKLYQEQTGKIVEPSENDLLKFLLWKEQKQKCLYTDDTIGIADFIGPNPKYDIEHTIPRSLYPDNSMANKTLANAKFNRDTKKSKMPSELNNHALIMARIEPWIKTAEELAKVHARYRKAKGLETKEQKDKRIQKKHEYGIQLEYWKKKINTFTRTDVPEGFKISQLIDTGIITRYAALYLKSAFPKVYTIKGTMVAEFRKLWGIQGYGNIKNRSNHAHHCIDAITIAAINKARYDKLAVYYKNRDQGTESSKLVIDKPWKTFTEDVLAVPEQLLISHYSPNNTGKHSKKALRKRGIVQKTKTGDIKYQQGDTARDGLHKESFYAAIKQNQELVYVIRKTLNGLKQSDIGNIVDPKIRECIEQKITSKELALNKGCISLVDDQIVWFNQAKGVDIKKVRVKTSIKKPLEVKQHNPTFLSKHEHKQKYYAETAAGGNYGAVVFTYTDNKGKEKLAMEVINNFNLYPLIKASTGLSVNEAIMHLLSQKYMQPTICYTLTTGTQVIFYDHNVNELKTQASDELHKRMYVMYSSSDGDLKFKSHTNAQPTTEIQKLKKESPERSHEYESSQFNIAHRSLLLRIKSLKNHTFAVENTHFKIDTTGQIHWLNA